MARSPNSSSVPEWNYRLIQCYGGNRDGFEEAIRHYFDQEIAIRAKNRPCSNLESYVSGIDKKFDDYVKFAEKLGLDHAEVSDGSIVMPHDEKCNYISKLSKKTLMT